MSPPPSDTAVHWRPAANGYEIGLDGSTLVCRNAAGRVLKSVPPAIRKSPEAEELTTLRDFLDRHDRECRSVVESWMLGAFPVPVSLLATLWPDPSWSTALTNMAVIADIGGEPGLLREVDGAGRVGVINLDAETEWMTTDHVRIAHPVLIEDLADMRDFATELGVTQAIPQLAREVHGKPGTVSGAAVSRFSGGEFDSITAVKSQAAACGFAVTGGFAVCNASDDDVDLQARYWIGAPDYYDEPVHTGNLVWVGDDERAVPLAEVGPIAWSEGIRMAELIFVGRTTSDG